MYYVYLLRSDADHSFYVGFTDDLKRRVNEHNTGKSRYTKLKTPWRLVFYEAYLNKYDALRREKYFKSTKGRKTYRTMLQEYLSVTEC